MNGLSTTEWLPLLLIAVAAAIYVIREALELAGKSPGAQLLRLENSDLVRRNHELEDTVRRLEIEINDLKVKIRDLEMTNQAAVLVALKDHERGAKERHAENQALLARAVNALEGAA